MTRFNVIFVLLLWSGTEPTLYPRYACTDRAGEPREGE